MAKKSKVVIEFNDPKDKLNRDALVMNLTNIIRVIYYDKDVNSIDVVMKDKTYSFKIV